LSYDQTHKHVAEIILGQPAQFESQQQRVEPVAQRFVGDKLPAAVVAQQAIAALV
jgi:hypothetical protein